MKTKLLVALIACLALGACSKSDTNKEETTTETTTTTESTSHKTEPAPGTQPTQPSTAPTDPTAPVAPAAPAAPAAPEAQPHSMNQDPHTNLAADQNHAAQDGQKAHEMAQDMNNAKIHAASSNLDSMDNADHSHPED